nr:RagB/SusD family nutrient uptake outer membrane protein [Niabella aurantiaca]
MFLSCNKFLDVVPDNTPVLDQAFAKRTMAERYLATCYNGLPANFSLTGNPAWLSADEFWLSSTSTYSGYNNWFIALGSQNGDAPLVDNWTGAKGGKSYWEGISKCNTFLENIMNVPDMDETEKQMWTAEVKFLKAYYHFLLVKQYGPIPIMDKNIPVYSDPAESRLPRNTVDECFSYIVGLMDEDMEYLMDDVADVQTETGRITKVAAKAMKAEILVYAASPLFNGNNDVEASIKNKDAKELFNHMYAAEKWQRAATACKEAIDFAEGHNKRLHTWTPLRSDLQQSTVYQMSIREAFNESSNNPEILWLDTRSIATTAIQGAFMLRKYTGSTTLANTTTLSAYMSVPLNIVEKFYSKNGVPIEEDKTYPYSTRFDLVTVPNTNEYKYDLVANRNTARMNLDREDRFYGTLTFDAGRIYMRQVTDQKDANAYNIDMRNGGVSGKTSPTDFNFTGYASKKHFNYQNSASDNNYSARQYGYPIMRLANLYLYYAEALNEVNGPTDEVYTYIDRVRARSGLEGVVSSWANYSSDPSKPLSKDGMRKIIKRERTCELALEGIRFWDLRRWKDAVAELNTPIRGWDIYQYTDANYYRPAVFFTRAFINRDYFWPISLNERRVNSNLVQAAQW